MGVKKPLVLFDMDGTLTPARKKAQPPMVTSLQAFSEVAQVGIVSGSGVDYILEQLEPLVAPECGANFSFLQELVLLPCNGTQIHRYVKDHWVCVYSTEMKPTIGFSAYRRLIRSICQLQCELIDAYPRLPLTGHFISDRTSLVNWCPVGREATPLERAQFIEIDQKHGLRTRYKRRLREMLTQVYGIDDLQVVLGGQTSFDIYPRGWDKSYALKHFPASEVWFVGDKCQPGGNDHEIYEALAGEGRAFEVNGPDATQEVMALLSEKFLRV